MIGGMGDISIGELHLLSPGVIGGTALWAVGLYWFLSPVHNRVYEALTRWLAFDSEGAVSSLLAIFPFVLAAFLQVLLTNITLGGSWSVAWGVMMFMGGGIYEIGRRDTVNRAKK